MVSLNQMPPDEDRGPLLKGTTWAITGAAVVVVILRLFARTIMRNSAGFDDVLMVIALGVNLASESLMEVQMHHGFGRHIYYLTTPDILMARKYTILAAMTGFVDQFFSRASILVFIMRLTPPTLHWPRRVAWLAHALNFAVMMTGVVGFGLQCYPLAGAWNPSINTRCCSVHVSASLMYATGALNCITDVTAALVPMIMMRHLQVSHRLKCGVFICLSLGLLCAACSIGKMTQVDFSEDFTWTVVPSEIWATYESKVAVIVGSMPALRQLYTSLNEPSEGTAKNSTYTGTTTSAHTSWQRQSSMYSQRLKSHGKRVSDSAPLNTSRVQSFEAVGTWYDSREILPP